MIVNSEKLREYCAPLNPKYLSIEKLDNYFYINGTFDGYVMNACERKNFSMIKLVFVNGESEGFNKKYVKNCTFSNIKMWGIHEFIATIDIEFTRKASKLKCYRKGRRVNLFQCLEDQDCVLRVRTDYDGSRKQFIGTESFTTNWTDPDGVTDDWIRSQQSFYKDEEGNYHLRFIPDTNLIFE